MASKRYISKTGVKYTFLVSVNGSVKSISFKGNEKDCIINDPATQMVVEDSEYFKKGLIGVATGTRAGGFDETVTGLAGVEKTKDKLAANRSDTRTNAEKEADEARKTGSDETVTVVTETKEYPDVTDFQSARNILLCEPYNIAPQAVAKAPEAILKKAAELGVSFPNLKLEQ